MLLGTQRVNERGHLEIGGCDATELARDFGTPLYVMDTQAIRERCREYKSVFGKFYPRNNISFASKAYLNLAICRLMQQEGIGLDVASAGELYTAVRAGFPMDHVLLHGNNKSHAELSMALEQGVGRVVVDNLWELRSLADMAQQMGKKQKIFLRITPGIDPHTHRRIRTGQEDTKFGMSISGGVAIEAVTEALSCRPHLELTGLHCHIGSQLLDSNTHVQAIGIMVQFLKTVSDQTGWVAEDLDIGGGLGIRYLSSQQPPTLPAFAESLIGSLRSALSEHNLPEPVLWQEPGRSLVGEAGTTLYEAGAIKHVSLSDPPGVKTYISIDGGLSDNPRPQLYDAEYEILCANKMGAAKDHAATIAGKHCETDILIQNVQVCRIQQGDILAVQSTGAYNQAMASNYNRFTRPACVFVQDGQAEIATERETLDDLLRYDRIPAMLESPASGAAA